MKKKLLAACGCLAAMVLALALVRILVVQTMPDYPDSIGSDPAVTEKITGEYLVEQAAAEPDTLLVYGSSELKTTDICTHPANFFAGKRCGFQVDLVGRGSCQSLVHALSIAASGESLRGQKVVLITAPQSYVEDGIAPDLFMANFSGQQVLSMLADDTIPDSIRQYLSRRVQTLMGRYQEIYGGDLQKYTAAGLLTRAEAAGDGFTAALLQPYAAASRWLLDTKDLVSARKVMKRYDDVEAKAQPVDWAAEEQAALDQAAEMVTNNEFFMQDDYYSTYIGRKLDQQAGKDAGLSYAESPEYDDLRCLLELCRVRELQVLFVHVPMHGSWNDYTGFDAEARAAYYEKVREIVSEYGNVTLLDLTEYEYEPYFLCDTMHLGWKGWLEVDRAMVSFYGEA